MTIIRCTTHMLFGLKCVPVVAVNCHPFRVVIELDAWGQNELSKRVKTCAEQLDTLLNGRQAERVPELTRHLNVYDSNQCCEYATRCECGYVPAILIQQLHHPAIVCPRPAWLVE